LLDPREPSPHPERLHYLADGRIEIDDIGLQRDIDEHLNLNLDRLKANRRAALAKYLELLKRRHGATGTWSSSALKKAVRDLEPSDETIPPEYVEVLLYWLRRKLQNH
jgi:hypothetical protein